MLCTGDGGCTEGNVRLDSPVPLKSAPFCSTCRGSIGSRHSTAHALRFHNASFGIHLNPCRWTFSFLSFQNSPLLPSLPSFQTVRQRQRFGSTIRFRGIRRSQLPRPPMECHHWLGEGSRREPETSRSAKDSRVSFYP